MAWTDDRIALLRTSWESGMTASQIAEALGEGVTRNAVIGKAHRLGLESRPSPVKLGEVVEDLIEGIVAAASDALDSAGAAIAAVVTPRPAPKRPSRAVAPVKPAKTTLLDLSEKVCKWPIGHPGDTDFHFCGKPSQAGFPYCTEHCAIAYQAQLPRRDRSRPPPPVMPGMGPRR